MPHSITTMDDTLFECNIPQRPYHTWSLHPARCPIHNAKCFGNFLSRLLLQQFLNAFQLCRCWRDASLQVSCRLVILWSNNFSLCTRGNTIDPLAGIPEISVGACTYPCVDPSSAYSFVGFVGVEGETFAVIYTVTSAVPSFSPRFAILTLQ